MSGVIFLLVCSFIGFILIKRYEYTYTLKYKLRKCIRQIRLVDLVGDQPMTAPTGQVYSFKAKYNYINNTFTKADED